MFRELRGFFFPTYMVKCVMFSDVVSQIVHGILLYVLYPQMIPIFHSCYAADVLCIVEVPSSLIRQYISFFTSNLAGILVVDYLAIVLVILLIKNLLLVVPRGEDNIFPYFLEFTFYFWTNVYFWINIVSIYYIVFVDVLSILFIVVFYH